MAAAAPDVVTRAVAGDPDAFADIYREHRSVIYLFIVGKVRDQHTAEDIATEVWIKVFRSLPGFVWQGAPIVPWIRTIARNLVTDHYRAAARRPQASSWDTAADLLTIASTDAEARPEETTASHLDALTLIRTLPPAQRAVLVCRFGHDMNIADTAAVLGKTPPAIKALQQRAIRTLHDLTAPQGS